MSKKGKVICLNCGKIGHTTKICRYPTNSYGCIVFKKSQDNIIRYLLIQRKYTPEYVELLRGRYYETNGDINYQYLLLLITELSLIERNYIIKYDFEYLWKNIWLWIGTEEQMQRIHSEYHACEKKFNSLKEGHDFQRYGHLSFQSLFEGCPTSIIEPDWELPKGKRHRGETDQECAVREFCEETFLEKTDISIYLHVKPFQERFIGVNGIKYCNSYYVTKLMDHSKPVYYDPHHTEQNKEIRKIGWFTENEIYQLINPRCLYRLKMIQNVNTLVSTLK
jgi:8-oxo-dGTP pyrophosphatase MutT (NUDIX family)